MDKKNNKKFKSLSSPSSQKITNFFKSVERCESKSNSDNAGSSSEKDLPKPKAIHKQKTVKDSVPKSPKSDVDHSRKKEEDCAKKTTIQKESSVKKNTIKDEKCAKKNSIKEEKCDKKNRVNEEQRDKKIKDVETNASDIKNKDIKKKEDCIRKTDSITPGKTIKNKVKLDDDLKKKVKTKDKSSKNKSKSVDDLNLKKVSQDKKCNNTSREKSESNKSRDNGSREIKHEASKNHKRHSDNNGEVDIKNKDIKKKKDCIRKTDSITPDKTIKNKVKLDDDLKKKVKTKDKSSKNKSKSVDDLNLKKVSQDKKCNNTTREKSESNKSRDNGSREIKHEASKNHKRHSDNNGEVDIKKNKINASEKHSTNIFNYLIFKSPKTKDKNKSVISKHKDTNSADKSKIEKEPKPDLREYEDRQKNEAKSHKINMKKRKRQSSGTDNSFQSVEEVHKKGTSSSKSKTESDKQDCESVGSSKKKKRRYSSDLEVKKVDRKKNKFYKMTKNVNGLDSWLSKSLKTKQIHNKYGMKVPTYMNIMKNVQRRKLYSEQLKEACKLIEEQSTDVSHVEKIEVADDGHHIILLKCTHLTLEEIAKYFTCLMEDCLDIINGRVFHERHEKYMSRAKKDMITASFLVYNVSTVVFSIEQKKKLANLCEKHFNKCDIYKPMQYYFKVLIPELCLKIFMLVHEMDKDSAIKYLENMPMLED